MIFALKLCKRCLTINYRSSTEATHHPVSTFTLAGNPWHSRHSRQGLFIFQRGAIYIIWISQNLLGSHLLTRLRKSTWEKIRGLFNKSLQPIPRLCWSFHFWINNRKHQESIPKNSIKTLWPSMTYPQTLWCFNFWMSFRCQFSSQSSLDFLTHLIVTM